MEPERSLPHSQVPATSPYPEIKNSPGPRLLLTFRNRVRVYGEELLAPRPTRKLEDHPLSAVRESFFNIFAATLYICLVGIVVILCVFVVLCVYCSSYFRCRTAG
jgi:hypothetical protein